MKIGNFNLNTQIRDKLELTITKNKLNDVVSGNNRPLILIRGVLRELINQFKDDDTLRTSIMSEMVFHYSIIMTILPKSILCVGSYNGLIPAICALACMENNYGKVYYLLDDYFREQNTNWLGPPWWELKKTDEHFKLLDIHKKIKTFRKFPKNVKFRYVVINSNRAKINVDRDVANVLPHLEKNGLMLLHNYGLQVTSKLEKFNDSSLKGIDRRLQVNSLKLSSNLLLLQKT